MNYNVIINEKEYLIPSTVSMFNEKLFEEYKVEENEKTYFDINRLVENKRIEDLDRLSFQSCAIVGELAYDDPETLQAYNKLGPNIRFWDNMAILDRKDNDIDKACQDYLKLMEIVLEFYNNLLEHEKNKTR